MMFATACAVRIAMLLTLSGRININSSLSGGYFGASAHGVSRITPALADSNVKEHRKIRRQNMAHPASYRATR